MFVTFDTLVDDSRIWIYQAERKLSSEEQLQITELGQRFLSQWASHGQPLNASLTIMEHYFVVIGVDDRQLPSGCSIDASVGFMKEIGARLKLDFFGRTKVPLWIDGSVSTVPLADLKNQIRDGELSAETKLINTLVQKKSDLHNWIMPIKESWLARYLPQPQHK